MCLYEIMFFLSLQFMHLEPCIDLKIPSSAYPCNTCKSFALMALITATFLNPFDDRFPYT